MYIKYAYGRVVTTTHTEILNIVSPVELFYTGNRERIHKPRSVRPRRQKSGWSRASTVEALKFSTVNEELPSFAEV